MRLVKYKLKNESQKSPNSGGSQQTVSTGQLLLFKGQLRTRRQEWTPERLRYMSFPENVEKEIQSKFGTNPKEVNWRNTR